MDGEFRSFLTIVEADGVLKAVELGAAALAREISEFNGKNPGDRKALFRLDRLKCDFIWVNKTNSPIQGGEYYPLHSARLIFNTTDISSYSRRELYEKIHRQYREFIQTDR